MQKVYSILFYSCTFCLILLKLHAKKEGALLVTNDPYDVEDSIREIISLKEFAEN